MNYTITKNQYESLKLHDLNFEKTADKYLTKEEITAIGFQETLYLTAEEGGSYANFSSFAYWENRNIKQAFYEARENLKVLQSWNLLQEENGQLRAGYVLLGVNAGAKGMGIKGIETFEHFEMFQLRSLKDNDNYKRIPNAIRYKNALIKTGNEKFYNEVVSGTYMTDFIKGFPTNYGPDIPKKIKEIGRELNYTEDQSETFYTNVCKLFGEILVNELALLGGQTHTLVVMGKNKETNVVNEFLRRSGLDEQYKVTNISHYSGSPTHIELANEIIQAFQQVRHSKSS